MKHPSLLWRFAVLGLAWPALAAAAAPYPSQPITVLVPFAAGSGTDVNTRQVTSAMSKYLNGVTFVVENRPGANGAIAARAAAQAQPDGYTLLASTNTTHAANPHLFQSLGYAPLEDFVPVGILGSTAPVLLRGKSRPIDTVAELRALATAPSSELDFAVTNASGELATRWLAQAAGLNTQFVPYKSMPQALTDLASGQVDFLFGDVASSRGLMESGAVTALAVASPTRLAALPSLPTLSELGVGDIDVQIWLGLFARSGTPAAVLDRLNDALSRALQEPEVAQMLLNTGVGPGRFNRDEAAQFVQAQYDLWGDRVKQLQIEKR